MRAFVGLLRLLGEPIKQRVGLEKAGGAVPTSIALKKTIPVVLLLSLMLILDGVLVMLMTDGSLLVVLAYGGL